MIHFRLVIILVSHIESFSKYNYWYFISIKTKKQRETRIIAYTGTGFTLFSSK